MSLWLRFRVWLSSWLPKRIPFDNYVVSVDPASSKSGDYSCLMVFRIDRTGTIHVVHEKFWRENHE